MESAIEETGGVSLAQARARLARGLPRAHDPAPAPDRRSLSRRALPVYLALGALDLAGYPFLRHTGLAYDCWYQSFSLLAVGAIFVGCRLHRPRALVPWAALAVGQALFGAGDSVYLVYKLLGHSTPFPSFADLLYLSGYPTICAALLLMIRSRSRSPGRDWASLIDALIVTTGLAAVSWVFLIEPYTRDSTESLLQKLTSAAYPLMDVLLLAVSARMLITAGKRSSAFWFLVAAIVVQLLGDSVYGIASLQGWYTQSGSFTDVSFVVAYLLWGAAGLDPSMVSLTEVGVDPERRLSRKRLLVLAIAALLAPAMLALELLRAGRVSLLIGVAASVVLFGLVIARLAGIVARHERAVQRERRLGVAAAALVAARSREEVAGIALAATIELACQEQVEVRVALELIDDPRLARLGERSSGGGQTWPATQSFPVSTRDASLGTITVLSERVLSGEASESVITLALQVSLALESVSLAEDILERQSAERFRALVQNSSDLIAVLEPDLTIRYNTPSVEALLGYQAEELIGVRLGSVVHPDDRAALIEFCGAVSTRAEGVARHEFRLRRHDGSWCVVEGVASNLLADEHVRGIVLTAHDVTESRALEAQLKHQAFHDPLTGLPNRALFLDRVEHALQRRHDPAASLAVLVIDLDDFKTINDSLGHTHGDELLVAAAQGLRDSLRPEDTCARLGGDEFTVLLEGLTELDTATSVAERILEVLARPYEALNRDMPLRASVGIAFYRDGETVGDLLRNADLAMYRAKRGGKGGFEIFEPSMHAAAVRRLELKRDLGRALSNGELELHYQPIVELASGRTVSLEGLVRWAHPQRGLISPVDFVPLAEETGLILPLGQFVLERACLDARAWRVEAGSAPSVAVNVSARQLRDPNLPSDVARSLDRAALDPRRLVLEITETVIASDQVATALQLNALTALGARIAIDDFGTGYSAMEYLRHFPISVLKIAKPFIDELAVANPRNRRLVAAILNVGLALELETIAEGIESASQRTRLLELGCPRGQGYFYSRPLPSAEVQSYLERDLIRTEASPVRGATTAPS